MRLERKEVENDWERGGDNGGYRKTGAGQRMRKKRDNNTHTTRENKHGQRDKRERGKKKVRERLNDVQ